MGEITLKKIVYVFIFFILLGFSIIFYGFKYGYDHPEDTKQYTNYCKSLGFENYYNRPSKDYSYNITSILCEKRELVIENNSIIDRIYFKEEFVYDIPIDYSYTYTPIFFIGGLFTIFFTAYAAANFYPDD